MAMMKRQSISITARQAEWLEKEAKRLGVSVSEVIRQVIDKFKSK